MKNNIAIICLDYNSSVAIGQALATRLDMHFLDSMKLYEFDIKPRTISETIKEKGMDYFKKESKGTISYASSFEDTVMAVDSGMAELVDLKKNCNLVYIRKLPDLLKSNYLQYDSISDEEKEVLILNDLELVKRDKVLKDNADFIVYWEEESEKLIDSIVSQIKKHYGVK